ncbi:MAG: PaaI family thioesterase [Tissierellia bacterium]|nr:PaaI family thioesterase [Tissierellia bacterium]
MKTNNNYKLDENLALGVKNFIKTASQRYITCESLEIEEVATDFVKMSVEVLPQTSNPYGMIHGGVLFTLADSVAGLTCITMGKKVVTLTSNIQFVKSARSGRVHASPRILHKGRTTILMEVDMVDDSSNLISKASFNMFVIGDLREYEEDHE